MLEVYNDICYIIRCMLGVICLSRVYIYILSLIREERFTSTHVILKNVVCAKTMYFHLICYRFLSFNIVNLLVFDLTNGTYDIV